SPFEDPSSITSVDDKARKIVRTSIGNLPFIHIGSIWKDGYYQDPAQFKFTEMRLRRITFDDSTTKVIRADHRLENGKFLIDKKYWPISLREGLDAKCLYIDFDDEP